MMIAVVTKPNSKMTMVDKHNLSETMLATQRDPSVTDMLVVAQDEAMNNTIHRSFYKRDDNGNFERVKQESFALGTPSINMIG
jgi:hypothetical protein